MLKQFIDILVDVKEDGSFHLNMDYFTYATSLRMTGKKFDRLFGMNQRSSGGPITSIHMDLARSVQQVTEDIVLRMLNHLSNTHSTLNLCLAGGVALNCVLNGKILKNTAFKNIWINATCRGCRGSIGGAYAVYYNFLGKERIADGTDKMKGAFLGPSYSQEYAIELLEKEHLVFQKLEDTELYKTLAEEIANGKVIGFFNGRMEFGPRALGARSIIGDARNPGIMQSVMNLKIKFRESFRPFAPVVLEEYCSDYFDLNTASPYMLLVAEILQKHRIETNSEIFQNGLDRLKQVRSVIPSATHVDYSARVQTVNAVDNPNFHALLQAFYTLTGCPVIINTSFNVKDEPIVCTPEDALQCFRKSEMDIVVIENLLIYKSKQVGSV